MKVSLYVITLIIVTALLALVDLPSLLKQKNHKELLVVVGLFSIGFILNFLLIVGAKLPNPNKLIISLFEALLK